MKGFNCKLYYVVCSTVHFWLNKRLKNIIYDQKYLFNRNLSREAH